MIYRGVVPAQAGTHTLRAIGIAGPGELERMLMMGPRLREDDSRALG